MGDLALERAISTLQLKDRELDDTASVSTVGGDVDALTDMAESDFAEAVGAVEWSDLGAAPPVDACKFQVVEEVGIPSGHCIVSVVKRSGFKSLHKMGSCSVQPYKDYKVHSVSQAEHSSSDYSAKCKLCWEPRNPQLCTSSSDTGTVSS